MCSSTAPATAAYLYWRMITQKATVRANKLLPINYHKQTIAKQLKRFTCVFIIYVSSLPSSNREMTRNPNWTVVGGTIGHITLAVQAADEDDALVEDDEHDEQDEERDRDRCDCKRFSPSLKSKFAFSVLEIGFRPFLLCRPPMVDPLNLECRLSKKNFHKNHQFLCFITSPYHLRLVK